MFHVSKCNDDGGFDYVDHIFQICLMNVVLYSRSNKYNKQNISDTCTYIYGTLQPYILRIKNLTDRPNVPWNCRIVIWKKTHSQSRNTNIYNSIWNRKTFFLLFTFRGICVYTPYINVLKSTSILAENALTWRDYIVPCSPCIE